MSEAFVFNLRGPNPTAAGGGELGGRNRRRRRPDLAAGVRSRQTDVRSGERVRALAGGGGARGRGGERDGNGRAMLAHARFFTDFKNSHALRLRHASRSKSAPAPGRPSWRCAVAQNLTTPAVGSGFRARGSTTSPRWRSRCGAHARASRTATRASSHRAASCGSTSRWLGRPGRDRGRRSARRARRRARRRRTRWTRGRWSAFRALGARGVGFEWREWRERRGVVRTTTTTTGVIDGRIRRRGRAAKVRVRSGHRDRPARRRSGAFCEFNALGTLRDDLVFGRRDTHA